jgi:hypothetical protein
LEPHRGCRLARRLPLHQSRTTTMALSHQERKNELFIWITNDGKRDEEEIRRKEKKKEKGKKEMICLFFQITLTILCDDFIL